MFVKFNFPLLPLCTCHLVSTSHALIARRRLISGVQIEILSPGVACGQISHSPWFPMWSKVKLEKALDLSELQVYSNQILLVTPRQCRTATTTVSCITSHRFIDCTPATFEILKQKGCAYCQDLRTVFLFNVFIYIYIYISLTLLAVLGAF